MISRYAIVENGLVTNLAVWDGEADWEAPEGSEAILLSEDLFVDIGFICAGGEFMAPASL